jgi:aminobenzoyl-glutamate transport protein
VYFTRASGGSAASIAKAGDVRHNPRVTRASVPPVSPASRSPGLLDRIERIGNRLPDPATLFLAGAALVFGLSWVAATRQWESVLLDAAGDEVMRASATNLLGADGFRWLVENLIDIFITFRPLGLVLVAAIGIAVAEKSGLITAALKAILTVAPRRLLTPATFLAGVLSSLAIDAGYIVLPPLAAAIYRAVGRSPLVGLAAVFAGVASGFNANLLVTGLDPLLAGLTQAAAQILDPQYHVNPAANWWFMIASTVVITGAGWAVTHYFVEPRLQAKPVEEGGPGGTHEAMDLTIDASERRGLIWAGLASAAVLGVIVANVVFPWGVLYDPPGTVGPGLARPFATWIGVIVPLLLVLFLVPGLAYGVVVRTIRSDRDVVRMMSEYMSILGNYIVLAFFAAIFVASFEHSGLGRMLAIEGGELLRHAGLPTWALMIGFIIAVAFANLFIGSMSAKWAMLATVFVPMLMTAGVSPELTQAAYRIGDSVTNSITPLNPYLVVVLVFMQQHVRKAGLGTLIALMLPYAVVFLVVWTLLLVAWILLGLPLGIEGPLLYDGF